MKLLRFNDIKSLQISPAVCVDWVRESFLMKERSVLPAKTSIYPQGNDFFNTMPCLLPDEFHRFGVKEARRVAGAVPSIDAVELLYDSLTGRLLAIMDANWITMMRTGAVATLAAQTFRSSGEQVYSFIGLGNTARATLLCLLESERDIYHKVCLLRYKDQAELFSQRFSNYDNVCFEYVDNVEALAGTSTVLFSCVTDAGSLICPDDRVFPEGILVVPVHTKGFQNCDLFFDKVFADDRSHVCDFKYFDRFRSFEEIGNVLAGKCEGRTDDSQRILSYNIGIGLHDVLFASRIYDKVEEEVGEIDFENVTSKFWV